MAYVMDFKDPDFLWATLDIAIWSDVEQGLAITAGSLATLRPLYRQIASRFGFDQTGNGGSDPNTPGKSSAVKWLGAPTTDEHRRKKGIFTLNSRLRTEKGTTRKSEDEYGLGDLQPIRLRDDLIEEQSVDTCEKGFNTWTIEAGKGGMGGEKHLAGPGGKTGAITLHKQIIQASSERRSMDRRS
jgi:hypothetical protein